ncbi:hypothetical protein GCM10007424_06180 [Flavobacterium suaedae]|uniref:Thioredoxin domain-containing protein n=1 Tax=Flavobacterium suaedae TaxID=1767027 RepID=A0ABQ1JLM3_9FLAO|nr:T9SS type A sorting domain-containing protein [Flavobacterium suaedae]GGB68980.1 hypothetical protein GCM10007424_06180 [Flavobacterium suaedae]
MKKTLLLGLLALAGFSANAQIADGSEAPDFSGTDVVTQEEISLQAYLDEGKTVVVYMSAAWCGPCWSFHNTHYLSDIYHAYGPEGSDEIAVIYIESDWRTPEGEIFGEDLPQDLPSGIPAPPAPLGDWTEGTPYPIINNDNVGAEYDIPGYPTMFAICPQGVGEPGIVTEIERGTPAELTQFINGACTQLEGVENWAKIEAGDARYCESTGDINFNLTSFGSNVTSATIDLKKNGTVVDTQTFTVELGLFEAQTVAFENVELDGSAEYQVELTQVNGETPVATIPENLASENFTVVPNASVDSYQNIKVTIHTDEWANEMKAYILDSSGNIVWNTPNYTAADNEQTFEYVVTLEDIDCYMVAMTDSYGDGWTYNESGPDVPHGIIFETADGATTLFESDGDFAGQVFIQEATFKTNGQLDAEKFNTDEFSIYPNPSTGIFNFATQSVVDVTVIDVTGKTVHTQKGINNGDTMNLSQLQPGVYIAKVTGENTAEKTLKLVIK